MASRKVILLFLCGLSAAYLALFHQPQRKVVVISSTTQSTLHTNKQDRSILQKINELANPAVPHLSKSTWMVKAIEHKGEHSYVVAEAIGEEKSEGVYRFLIKHQGKTDTTIAAYQLLGKDWKLIYGEDFLLKDEKLLTQGSPQS